MSNDNAWLGKASLWISISGVVLPVCLAVLVFILADMGSGEEALVIVIYGYSTCVLLLVLLELVAFSCGIAARGTATGKTGLVISVGIAVLFLLLGLVAWIRFGSGAREMPPSPGAPPPRAITA
jgi:hypothetical protein